MYAHIYMDPQQEDKFISTTPWDHMEQKNVSHLHVVFLEENPVGAKVGFTLLSQVCFLFGIWQIFAMKYFF